MKISQSILDHQKIWFWLIVLAYLLVFGMVAQKYFPTRFDDAYIFIRFSKNFWDGHGFSWNFGDPPVHGSTSFLYLCLVTLLYKLIPAGDAVVLQTASMTMGILSVVGLYSIAGRYTSLKQHQLNYSVASVFLLLIIGRGFLYHCFTGMDTTLSMLSNVLFIGSVLQFRNNQDVRSVIFMIALGFMSYLVRPDNLIHVTVTPILIMIFDVSANRKIKLVGIFILSIALLVSAKALFDQLYFQDIFPLSYLVKQNGFYDGYTDQHLWNPMKYMINILIISSPFLLIIIFGISRTNQGLIIALTTSTVLTYAAFFNTVQIMGMEARFYYPSLPYIIVPAILLLDEILKNPGKLKPRFKSATRLVSCFILFLIISTQNSLIAQYRNLFLQPGSEYKNPIATQPDTGLVDKNDWFSSIEFSAEIASQCPSGTIIAATEIGLLASSAPHLKIIDMTGLQNPHIAHHGFSDSWILKKRPDIIFMHKGYSKMNTDLFDNPNFEKNYDVYVNVLYGGFAINKNSSNFNKLESILKETWDVYYPKDEMEEWLLK